jgi:hypothetical protein
MKTVHLVTICRWLDRLDAAELQAYCDLHKLWDEPAPSREHARLVLERLEAVLRAREAVGGYRTAEEHVAAAGAR